MREALQHIPGKYEDFLRVIYEFEISMDKQTAVDLYFTLQKLLHDWPQLLTDFAAFLLPEQALECGLVGRVKEADSVNAYGSERMRSFPQGKEKQVVNHLFTFCLISWN